MAFMEGCSLAFILLENAEERDFFILLLSWEFEVDLPPDACIDVFII